MKPGNELVKVRTRIAQHIQKRVLKSKIKLSVYGIRPKRPCLLDIEQLSDGVGGRQRMMRSCIDGVDHLSFGTDNL